MANIISAVETHSFRKSKNNRWRHGPALLILAWVGLSAAMTDMAYGDEIAVSGEDYPENHETESDSNYRIGPGDILQVFVWRNPEISTTIPVRPDGKISTPLVEDMLAVDKTPSQLARDMEAVLSKYIKSPSVNIIVSGFQGTPADMIRVVGQAQNPQSLPYRNGMTLLDVIIEVGGLGEFAAGNRSKLVRKIDGQTVEVKVRLKDLVDKGQLDHNVDMKPGDVVIIPEAWF